jgi:hypothetical protein
MRTELTIVEPADAAGNIRVYQESPSHLPALIVNTGSEEYRFRLDRNLILKVLSESANVARWMK